MGTSNKCEIRINVIDDNGRIRSVFITDKRDEEETITTYRDAVLIFSTLKEVSILKHVIVEKYFR